MNPDIRIEISFKGHRKRGKLQALLGPKSTDYLIDLWIGAALSRPEGILHGYDPLDIAIEAGWDGDPQEFVDALVKVGFLDILDNGTYALHDWEEHQPFVVKTKEREEHARKASNARWSRKRSRAEDAEGLLEVSSEDAQPMLGASSGNARGNAPTPIPIVSNTSKIEKSVSMLSASLLPEEPQTAPEPFVSSAPDGAASAHYRLNLEGHDLGPPSGACCEVESCQQECSPKLQIVAASERTTADQSLPDSQSQEITLAAEVTLSHSENEPLFYLTKRRRRLTGWKFQTFEDFWETFNLRKGKAEAADAWLDVLDLTPDLACKIIQAAEREAEARPLLVAKGRTPKWAQGWISARRWEDWEDGGVTTHHKDHASTQDAGHHPRGSRTQEDEDAEYYRSIREAVKRFM